MSDNQSRRLLRFSLLLQILALVLMGGALFVRVLAIGWDPVSLLVAALTIGIAAAAGWTWGRLKQP